MRHHLVAISIAALAALSTATLRGSVHAPVLPLHRAARADNAAVNQALSHRGERTADQQPNDVSDCKIAASVRRAVVHDDTLSVYGHNVKIIVAGGKVTLEGPVHNQAERDEVAFDAATVVPRRAIVNHIIVT